MHASMYESFYVADESFYNYAQWILPAIFCGRVFVRCDQRKIGNYMTKPWLVCVCSKNNSFIILTNHGLGLNNHHFIVLTRVF
jgi:hypothetical protein